MSWDTLNDSVYRLSFKKRLRGEYSDAIAIFDLDDTLIKTRSKCKFPKTATDWEFRDSVIEKLKEIVQTHTIIIITNQAVTKDRRPIVLERIQAVFGEICELCEPIFIECYVALEKDLYRKPCTTIFESWIYPRIKKIDSIYYVGDAAGRTGDFSDSDRKFAFNLHLYLKFKLGKNTPNIMFYTPEEYFQCVSAESKSWTGFNSYNYYMEHKISPEINFIKADLKYLILMIGPPASGKSTLSAQIEDKFPRAVIVSQDVEKTKARCLKVFNDALETHNIIIIDNMNTMVETRAVYIDRALEYDFQIICIFMDEPRELYQHMNIYREKVALHNKEDIKHIPDVVYNKYYKELEPPTKKEGLVIEWPITPKFNDKYELYMFLQRN